MDYLGQTIHSLLKGNGGRLDIITTCNYGIELIKAIKDVHSHGIIHRDIKPNNICVNGKDLYLIDFGVSTQY